MVRIENDLSAPFITIPNQNIVYYFYTFLEEQKDSVVKLKVTLELSIVSSLDVNIFC